jgi:hypothetical protein
VKVVWHDGSIRIPRPAEYADGVDVPGTGAILFGDKGMITHGSHGGGGCWLFPNEIRDQYTGENSPTQKIPRVKNHVWDWLEAIRTGRQAGSNFDFGAPLTQSALLGAIAIRFPGQQLQWDEAACRFTNQDDANAYVDPPYRAGWSL